MLWTSISGVPELRSLYEQIEQPLVPVLYRMEQAGVLIDGELLRQQSLELARNMREIEARAHDAAGGPFSLDSPKQLQDVLYGKLGLPVLGKTAADLFKNFFGETDPMPKLASFPKEFQGPVRAGEIAVGMTREMVLMSMGAFSIFSKEA